MTPPYQAHRLIALNPDVECHYQTFLRITEVCKLSTVCQALRERVRVSLRSHQWDAAHCEGVDPPPFTWLGGLAVVGVNFRSVKLVSDCPSISTM